MADIDNSDAALAALQIPPGIYRISVAHPSIESGSIGAETEAAAPDSTSVRQYLTDGESYVTIRPPNAQPDHRQLVNVAFLMSSIVRSTDPLSGELSVVKMATSSSGAPRISGHPPSSLTKALPRNPRQVTVSSCTYLISP